MKRALALSLIALATPALAGTKALDPRSAYVVIDIGDLEDSIMKGADLPGAVTIGRYDSVRKDIRGGELSPDTALPDKQSSHVVIDHKPVAKAKSVRQYVIEVQPDSWVIEGANGTAFSLGSVQFEVKPGEVVDLGVAKPSVDWAPGEGVQGKTLLKAMFFGPVKPKNDRPIWLNLHTRTATDLPLPPELAGRSVTPVAYVSGAKFGNYLGGLVNRIGGRAQRARELVAEQAGPAPASPADQTSAQ
jgi:hypothetical protein